MQSNYPQPLHPMNTTTTKQNTTSAAGHTPGPWHVEVWDYSHANPPRKELNVQTGSLLLATIAWDEGKDNPYTVQNDTAQANARLIAAAPELLEACIAMLRAPLLTPEQSAGAWTKGRAAINKAIGNPEPTTTP